MTVTIVDNRKKDWRRVYVGRELVAENHPYRINLHTVLVAIAREFNTTLPDVFTVRVQQVDDFNLLEEAGGVAQ